MKKVTNKKHWLVPLGMMLVGLVATTYLATGTQLFAQEESTRSEEVVVTDEQNQTTILESVLEEEQVKIDEPSLLNDPVGLEKVILYDTNGNLVSGNTNFNMDDIAVLRRSSDSRIQQVAATTFRLTNVGYFQGRNLDVLVYGRGHWAVRGTGIWSTNSNNAAHRQNIRIQAVYSGTNTEIDAKILVPTINEGLGTERRFTILSPEQSVFRLMHRQPIQSVINFSTSTNQLSTRNSGIPSGRVDFIVENNITLIIDATRITQSIPMANAVVFFTGLGGSFNPEINQGKVIVRHVNENDESISDDQILEGEIHAPYETAPKEIDGYTLVGTPANSSGSFTTDTVTVTYIYKAPGNSLTLEASPAEGGLQIANTYSLIPGQHAQLNAFPSTGYRFVRWEVVSGIGARVFSETTQNNAIFEMGSTDAVVRAVYEEIKHSLTLEASPAEGGNPRSEVTELAPGATTTITANPTDGYRFEHWEVISGIDARITDTASENTTFTMGRSNAAIRAIYEREQTDAVLTVEFINELEELLPGYTLTLEGYQIGDEVDLTKEQAVIDQITNLEDAGYELVERPANETAVQLNQAEVTVQYKVQGVLSLVSAPNTLDFGTLTYTAQAQRVDDPEFEEDLIVSDTRAGITDGWTLSATLSTPLLNEEGKELVNALRYVWDGEEHVLSQFAQPIYTNPTTSAGVFNISETWGTTAQTDGLKLQIETEDDVYIGRYTGVITWKVMAGQP